MRALAFFKNFMNRLCALTGKTHTFGFSQWDVDVKKCSCRQTYFDRAIWPI